MRMHPMVLAGFVVLGAGCAMNPTQQQKIAADKRAASQCLSRQWLKLPYSVFDNDRSTACDKHRKAGCYDVPSGHPDLGDIMQQCP